MDTLFKRGLLQRDNKLIKSTPAGRGLIHALPSEATYPDMTAHWNINCKRSRKGQAYQPFMQTLQGRLEQLIEQVQVAPVPVSLQALPAVSKPAFKRTRRAPKSKARTYKV